MRHVKKFTWHVALNLVLWAIETAIFNRIRHFVLGEQRDEAWLKNARDMAVSVADELENRKLVDAAHDLASDKLAPLVHRELVKGRWGDEQTTRAALHYALAHIDLDDVR